MRSRIEALTEHDSELVPGRKPVPDIPAAFLEVADRQIDGNDPRVLIDLRNEEGQKVE
jgi:hypothetical protein